MKFAHLADCHIGGWREDKLTQLGINVFREAINKCVKENIGFILISGDLFNTALPAIELLKETAEILNIAKENNISVYIIPGSHDFSPSGKTMIEVLEKAGLLENVFKFKDNKLKFTLDKTGVKITGIYGLRAGLEKETYKELNKDNLENEQGFKIFMFHTALEEFKPEELEKVEGLSIASLPKNFNYYAGGHVHYIFDKKFNNGLLAFPGALFPNNFIEIEKFKNGGFYIVNDKLELNYIPITLKEVLSFKFDADTKLPEELEKEILNTIKDYEDKIITIRVEGILKQGKPSDIDFKKIFSKLEQAFIVLKNTNKLSSKEIEEIRVESGNVNEIENKIVKDNIGKLQILKDEEAVTHNLILCLNKEKLEGEKNIDFENRLVEDFVKVLDLKDRIKDIR